MSATTALDRFRATGEVDQLAELGRLTFSSSPAALAVSRQIIGYFRPLLDGEHPDFRSVDPAKLEADAAPVLLTLEWIALSPLADFRSAAIELMGVLGWEAFLGRLAGWAFCGETWERIGAIGALGRIRSPAARRLIELARDGADAEIAAAASRALGSA